MPKRTDRNRKIFENKIDGIFAIEENDSLLHWPKRI
jgi:hypothetical protein